MQTNEHASFIDLFENGPIRSAQFKLAYFFVQGRSACTGGIVFFGINRFSYCASKA